MSVQHAGVVGSPIDHSLSPVIHCAAYRELGLDWTYEAIEQTEDSFPHFLSGLDHAWRGLSVTMPLKEVALAAADSRSELAQRVGAANTLIHGVDGWFAENTDVVGIVSALSAAGVSSCRQVTIMGGGATARSAFAAVMEMGARDVTVCVRRPDAGRAFADWAHHWDASVAVASMEPSEEAAAADVVIATVPFDAASPWAGVAGTGALLDVSYHPWPTVLSAAWRGPVANGRDLLLWQAVEQVRLMTGMAAPVAAMRAALDAA